ncbi:MAG: dihydroorotase [Flavobacteriales bacterium]
MKLLIKNVTIVDVESAYNGQTLDVLIENGRIKEIGNSISEPNADEIVDEEHLYLSQGAFDLIGSIPEPGEEYKESLQSGMKAAQKGGFTSIGLVPHNLSPCDKVEKVMYLNQNCANNTVDIKPIGALTNGLKGENMAELYDMYSNGAIAFAQNRTFLKNTEVMKTAVEYSRIFNGTVMSFPYDDAICKDAMVHEGKISVFLGLKGNPSIAEAMGVSRDLSIAEYTKGNIHFACISSKESVNKIREAKANGLPVTASVAVHNLAFTDDSLLGFDQNLKVIPPIRSEEDREALMEGLIDGTIDCVVSNHHPQDLDAKRCEFSIAQFGALSYQSTIPAAYEALKDKMDLDVFMSLFSQKPHAVINTKSIGIEVGNLANLTLFTTHHTYTFSKEQIVSKSKNSPYINSDFSWKSFGTYNKGIWTKN